MEKNIARHQFNNLKQTKKHHKFINLQLTQQNHKCFYCKKSFCNIIITKDINAYVLNLPLHEYHLDNYSIDHKIPLNKNGTNNFGNLVLACLSCNSKKYNKILSS